MFQTRCVNPACNVEETGLSTDISRRARCNDTDVGTASAVATVKSQVTERYVRECGKTACYDIN